MPHLFFSCKKSPDEQAYRDYAKAMQLYYSGSLDEAEVIFRDIRSEYPDFHENSRGYASCLYYEGKQDMAIQIWEAMGRQNELNIDCIERLSSCYIQNGRSDDAIPLLESGLSLSPHDPMLLYLMAQCRFTEGDTQAGLSLLLSAMSEMERQVVIPLELARIYHSFGFTPEAGAILERYSEYLGKDHPLKPSLMHLKNSLNESVP